MVEDLELARQCGREFTLASVPFSALSEALTFCDTDDERRAFLEGVVEGPPLNEEEEKAFGEWMDMWSPNEVLQMLQDYMSPSLKRAVVKEIHEMETEEDGG